MLGTTASRIYLLDYDKQTNKVNIAGSKYYYGAVVIRNKEKIKKKEKLGIASSNMGYTTTIHK